MALRSRTFIAIGGCITFLSFAATAELSWESTSIRQSIIPGDTCASTEFRFRNSGGYPVLIRSIRPSCDCTTFGLNQMHYESGDAGSIKLRMDIGVERGTINRTIDVMYEDTRPHHDTLHWTVNIPEPIIIKPDTIIWTAGTKDSRVIGIARAGFAPIGVTKVEASNDSFVYQLFAISVNDVYEIHVRPRDERKKTHALIRILAGTPGREVWHEIHAYVQ